jgi:hypothetical protein
VLALYFHSSRKEHVVPAKIVNAQLNLTADAILIKAALVEHRHLAALADNAADVKKIKVISKRIQKIGFSSVSSR